MEYLILTEQTREAYKGWNNTQILIMLNRVKYFKTFPCESGNTKVFYDDGTSFIVNETIETIKQLILKLKKNNIKK